MTSKYIISFHYSSNIQNMHHNLFPSIPIGAEIDKTYTRVGFNDETTAREFMRTIRKNYRDADYIVALNLINNKINKTLLTIYNK